MNKLEQDMRSLREQLFGNPEPTVTVALLKKNLESLACENGALPQELDRQNVSNKWFRILIILSIGLLGLSVSILLKRV